MGGHHLMGAIEVLVLAAEHRVTVQLEGSTLRLVSPEEPPEVVLDALRAAKVELLRILAEPAELALAATLAEAAARGARAAAAPPTDPEEAELTRAARAAIQADHDAPEDPVRVEGAWPELATLGPGVHAAFTSLPDGSVEVRHRQPDGSWSEPTVLPALRVRGGEAA